MKRTELRRKTPLRSTSTLDRGSPMRRGAPLKRTWMKRSSPKRLARRKHLAPFLAFVRKMPCVACGRRGPSDAAHMTLSMNEKSMGSKVPDNQAVPLCRKDHRDFDTHAGAFAGWTKDERYERALSWVTATQLLAIPESYDDALLLQSQGLGAVGFSGDSWHWCPGGVATEAA